MTTTTRTRRAYHPSYTDGAPGTCRGVDYTDRPSACTCGQVFANLGDLMGHDCPDDIRRLPRMAAVATTDADSLDHPAGPGHARTTTGTGRKPRGIQNRYPGDCAVCTTRVAANAGRAVKVDGRWLTLCRDHQHATDDDTAAARPAATPAAEAKTGCRPNRYPGPCRHCGGHVAAEAGLLCKVNGEWKVEHTAGACSPPAPAPAARPAAAVTLPDVPAGHYAIESTGDNDLAFYRVDRPTDGAYAGQVFVKMIVGGHPDMNVRRDNVAGILARIAEAGPAVAAERYGVELGRCCRCNRHLTDEESRRLGIGPECRKAG